jgi:hypothetical protein
MFTAMRLYHVNCGGLHRLANFVSYKLTVELTCSNQPLE